MFASLGLVRRLLCRILDFVRLSTLSSSTPKTNLIAYFDSNIDREVRCQEFLKLAFPIYAT